MSTRCAMRNNCAAGADKCRRSSNEGRAPGPPPRAASRFRRCATAWTGLAAELLALSAPPLLASTAPTLSPTLARRPALPRGARTGRPAIAATEAKNRVSAGAPRARPAASSWAVSRRRTRRRRDQAGAGAARADGWRSRVTQSHPSRQPRGGGTSSSSPCPPGGSRRRAPRCCGRASYGEARRLRTPVRVASGAPRRRPPTPSSLRSPAGLRAKFAHNPAERLRARRGRACPSQRAAVASGVG